MTDTHTPSATGPDVADPWLRRIRGLLDLAESTEFADEAAACTAKAFKLMATHHVHIAHVEAAREASDPSAVVEVPVDLGAGPYVRARLRLLVNCGDAYDCRVLTSVGRQGRVGHLIGHRSDVTRTQVLYTSLLTQATAAALTEPTPQGTAKITFRRAFLFAFASRVDERLSEARAAAMAHTAASAAANGDVDQDCSAGDGTATAGTSTAVVLADRAERVAHFVESRYPRIGSLRSAQSTASPAGRDAGRSAGDRADLGSGTPVGRARQALSA